MICLFCPIKECPDAGIVDGPGCCDFFPDHQQTDWEDEDDEWWMDEYEKEEMLIERGICPQCGKKLHSDG